MENIKIDKKTLEEINEHAVKEYPKECCGWVLQQKDTSLKYFAAENLQDKYHKLDPETYPRTSKDAFLMDTLKLSRATEAIESSGGSLFSIVHSHIDCDAYFSAEDELQMSTPDNNGPVFSAKCYIVVSIQNHKAAGNAVFIYDKKEKKYQKGNLVVSDA
ncbi:MAG: Mov34/MPN/PAD-1 family protein [Spirochaetia bacterium]|nr:Mov34/MPN/PAD-1 family protein [Spirochaetia bacterium]